MLAALTYMQQSQLCSLWTTAEERHTKITAVSLRWEPRCVHKNTFATSMQQSSKHRNLATQCLHWVFTAAEVKIYIGRKDVSGGRAHKHWLWRCPLHWRLTRVPRCHGRLDLTGFYYATKQTSIEHCISPTTFRQRSNIYEESKCTAQVIGWNTYSCLGFNFWLIRNECPKISWLVKNHTHFSARWCCKRIRTAVLDWNRKDALSCGAADNPTLTRFQ